VSEDKPQTERPAPKNVQEALARVIEEMPGVAKSQRADERQGGYAYRGIEDITRAVQPLLGKYGVVFVPEVVSREVHDLVVNGKAWTDTHLQVRYHIFGPNGTLMPGPLLWGVGRDNSDKGANKAMTQAYKYALLQLLCISDAADDGDAATVEADAPKAPKPAEKGTPALLEGWTDATEMSEAHQRLAQRIKLLPEQDRNFCRQYRKDHGWPMTREHFDELDALVAAVEDEIAEADLSAGHDDDE